MTFTKPVANIIPGVMALGLAGRAYKMVPSFDMISKDISKPTKDKKQTKDFIGDSMKNSNKNFIKGSMEILIGVPLIGAVAGSVAKL